MGNSKSRLRKALLFLYTTDREPGRTAVVAQADTAAVETKEEGAGAVRPRRPIVTAAASTVGSAVAVEAETGSREEYRFSIDF